MADATQKKGSFLNWFTNLAGLATPRKLEGVSKVVYRCLAIFFGVFFLYTAGPPFIVRIKIQYMRGLYVMLMSILVFIKYPAFKWSPQKRISLLDLICIAASILTFGYWILNFNSLIEKAGTLTNVEYYIAAIAVIVCLEVSRRVLGPLFPGIAAIVILYSLYGNAAWLPQVIRIKGFSWRYIAAFCYSLQGIFGSILYTIATFVTLFVIFGGLMDRLGASDFFIGLPYALTCGQVGGPGKTAVLASCLFGSISGSATANTAATGAFTISLMKKAGYRPEVAGAIEPAASTGGMFMPPVMGAGAFIMADMLNLSYGSIIKVAFAPALIYFFSVFMIVHYYARANNIPVIPKKQRPNPWKIFKDGFYYLIPLVLLVVLLVGGYSAQRSIYWTIILMMALVLIARIFKRGEQKLRDVVKKWFLDIIGGFEAGADGSLTIGAVAGTTGIVVAGISITGLGFSFTTAVMSAAKGYLILAIGLAFLAAYVLGMGLTVTAAYVLCATLATNSLVTLGMTALGAHFLLFWYSQTSNVSPPVCLAAFVGAGIADAHPYKTGFNALKFSAALLWLPLLFAYSDILMPNGLTFSAIWAMLGAAFATVPYAGGIAGYFFGEAKWYIRVLLMVVTVLAILPSYWSTGVAVVLFALIALFQKKFARQHEVREMDSSVVMEIEVPNA